MKGNKRRDTIPELAIRSEIHRQGLRYAIDARPDLKINRRADIVFRSYKVAVFIHGCFWHGCLKHYVKPKSNTSFWEEKIKRNRARDAETARILRRQDWTVLVIWEHQDPIRASNRIIRTVKNRRKVRA